MLDRTSLLVLILLLTALTSGCTSAQRTSASFTAKHHTDILTIGNRAITDDGIVGLSIGIAIDGKTVFAQGFGHADLEMMRPATANTVYDIASVGKQFTAAAIMRLIEENRLSLSDHIRDVLPETPPHFPNATIEELLHHTSGFVAGKFDEFNPPVGSDQPHAGLEVLDEIELIDGRIAFAPSETWVYCNPGFLLLGLVVEAVSGKSYAAFVDKELLYPAGITGMTVCRRPAGPIMSDSLHRSENGVQRVPFIHMSVYAGQGSVCSSVIDLLAWERALDTGKIMSRAALAQFRSPAQLRGTSGSAEAPYGMAQRLGSLYGHRKVGHTGTFEGGSAVLAHYPDDGLTITVLTNTKGKGIPHARSIETDIALAILGASPPDVDAKHQPVTASLRSQIEGVYDNGRKQLEARFDGDTLRVFQDGKVIEELSYIGGLQFRQHDKPRVREWFMLDGKIAGWWVYEVDGFIVEVGRRLPARR